MHFVEKLDKCAEGRYNLFVLQTLRTILLIYPCVYPAVCCFCSLIHRCSSLFLDRLRSHLLTPFLELFPVCCCRKGVIQWLRDLGRFKFHRLAARVLNREEGEIVVGFGVLKTLLGEIAKVPSGRLPLKCQTFSGDALDVTVFRNKVHRSAK
jgi:hypothetical protein